MKRRLITASLGLVVFVFWTVSCSNDQTSKKESPPASAKSIRIGFSMDTLEEERWQTDRNLFVQRAKELNVSVVVMTANSDDKIQALQAENLITQGVDVLVIIPHDAEAMSSAIEKAHKAGIKVISYDRLIKNCDLDLYISFDNEKVGELQAEGVLAKVNKGHFAYIGGAPTDNNAFLLKKGSMKVLETKIAGRDIDLVVDKFTPNWYPEEAYKTMKAYLDGGGPVDGVIAANDGVALGAIQALQEHGLAGKIPVSGQDADLPACKRIVGGTQTVTVYKPIKLLAYKAVELAVALAKGEKIETNSFVPNGKIDVPSYPIQPISVTKDNIDATIIKDGFHSYDEIYKNAGKTP